jgi:hypothetical protein
MAHPETTKSSSRIITNSYSVAHHCSRLCAFCSSHRSPPQKAIKNDIESFYLYQKYTQLRGKCLLARAHTSHLGSGRPSNFSARWSGDLVSLCMHVQSEGCIRAAAGCWMRAKICIVLLSHEFQGYQEGY